MSSTSRQVEAIAQEVREKFQKVELLSIVQKVLREAKWILMDLGDVVVNIMTRDDREYYGLDALFEKYPLKGVQYVRKLKYCL